MWPLTGLQAVALFEAAKGALVLLAGFGVFTVLHRDAQHGAEQIVLHFHLNPASHYPHIFLQLAERAAPHLFLLAVGACAYALLRFILAYGLWRGRAWAEWLAIVGSGLYLPIEMWELAKGITWLRVLLLDANLAVVIYLARTLLRSRPGESHPIHPARRGDSGQKL